MEAKFIKIDSFIISVEEFFITLFRLTKFKEKIMRVFNPETVIYLFVGVMTTVLNYAVFAALLLFFPGSEVASTAIAWVVAVVATFYPNKYLVFRHPFISTAETVKEFVSFCTSRLITLGVEVAGMWIFCDVFHFNGFIVKAVLAVAVVILNYIFSKIFVFAKEK